MQAIEEQIIEYIQQLNEEELNEYLSIELQEFKNLIQINYTVVELPNDERKYQLLDTPYNIHSTQNNINNLFPNKDLSVTSNGIVIEATRLNLLYLPKHTKFIISNQKNDLFYIYNKSKDFNIVFSNGGLSDGNCSTVFMNDLDDDEIAIEVKRSYLKELINLNNHLINFREELTTTPNLFENLQNEMEIQNQIQAIITNIRAINPIDIDDLEQKEHTKIEQETIYNTLYKEKLEDLINNITENNLQPINLNCFNSFARKHEDNENHKTLAVPQSFLQQRMPDSFMNMWAHINPLTIEKDNFEFSYLLQNYNSGSGDTPLYMNAFMYDSCISEKLDTTQIIILLQRDFIKYLELILEVDFSAIDYDMNIKDYPEVEDAIKRDFANFDLLDHPKVNDLLRNYPKLDGDLKTYLNYKLHHNIQKQFITKFIQQQMMRLNLNNIIERTQHIQNKIMEINLDTFNDLEDIFMYEFIDKLQELNVANLQWPVLTKLFNDLLILEPSFQFKEYFKKTLIDILIENQFQNLDLANIQIQNLLEPFNNIYQQSKFYDLINSEDENSEDENNQKDWLKKNYHFILLTKIRELDFVYTEGTLVRKGDYIKSLENKLGIDLSAVDLNNDIEEQCMHKFITAQMQSLNLNNIINMIVPTFNSMRSRLVEQVYQDILIDDKSFKDNFIKELFVRFQELDLAKLEGPQLKQFFIATMTQLSKINLDSRDNALEFVHIFIDNQLQNRKMEDLSIKEVIGVFSNVKIQLEPFISNIEVSKHFIDPSIKALLKYLNNKDNIELLDDIIPIPIKLSLPFNYFKFLVYEAAVAEKFIDKKQVSFYDFKENYNKYAKLLSEKVTSKKLLRTTESKMHEFEFNKAMKDFNDFDVVPLINVNIARASDDFNLSKKENKLE